jgi:hypothetical protein
MLLSSVPQAEMCVLSFIMVGSSAYCTQATVHGAEAAVLNVVKRSFYHPAPFCRLGPSRCCLGPSLSSRRCFFRPSALYLPSSGALFLRTKHSFFRRSFRCIGALSLLVLGLPQHAPAPSTAISLEHATQQDFTFARKDDDHQVESCFCGVALASSGVKFMGINIPPACSHSRLNRADKLGSVNTAHPATIVDANVR